MASIFYPLPERGLLHVQGGDATSFLQGLITNDIAKAADNQAIYAALLTPQGKYLHDFLIIAWEGGYVLDTAKDRLPDLQKRLTLYRLRSKVTLADISAGWEVFACESSAPPALGAGACFADPREARLGSRAILPAGKGTALLREAGLTEGKTEDYTRLRVSLGVPEGGVDLIPEKSFLLESRFEELHGIDFKKGCFVGQEVTARTKHLGKVRKKLHAVAVQGITPAPGTPVIAGGTPVGELRSSSGGYAIAMLRLEETQAALVAGTPLAAGEATLTPLQPVAAE